MKKKLVNQKKNGGRTTKRNSEMNKITEWVKQIDKAYAGENLVCPVCGEKTNASKFYVFPDGVGYCDFICNNCGEHEHLSRIKYPEYVKIEPILLDNVPTAKR